MVICTWTEVMVVLDVIFDEIRRSIVRSVTHIERRAGAPVSHKATLGSSRCNLLLHAERKAIVDVPSESLVVVKHIASDYARW